MNNFGNELKELRTKKRYPLRTLAASIGITPSFLSDIENGRRMPPNSDKTGNVIQKIIEVLDLNETEAEHLMLCADQDLNEKGILSKDMELYINSIPTAQLALRKAATKNVDMDKWEEIIKIIEGE